MTIFPLFQTILVDAIHTIMQRISIFFFVRICLQCYVLHNVIWTQSSVMNYQTGFTFYQDVVWG